MTNYQVQKMNDHGRRIIAFGNEHSRHEKVFPNCVYLTLQTMVNTSLIFFKVYGSKTKKKKLEEKL